MLCISVEFLLLFRNLSAYQGCAMNEALVFSKESKWALRSPGGGSLWNIFTFFRNHLSHKINKTKSGIIVTQLQLFHIRAVHIRAVHFLVLYFRVVHS